ncbi:hypothetical protein GWI33_008780 [Rhynchophorus ferrugineus]|uniref:Rad21/Rec8-like protein N-terminal domain-containing protein n=1 Tax=Rhynchophorus ferrugineus TaxID=354439 RepID=A0A834IFR8_RHYFE|nr:hypothetical protein GWI33_008780 [Rhynchophorus ferrugineus]
MRLSLPWRAATVGISKLSPRSIKGCDVVTLCNCISEFITNNSLNPSKRFSLRLSTILIHGVCLIYRKQVMFLQADIDCMISMRMHALLHSQLTFEDSPLPKPKIKKPRKKENLSETPESLRMISVTASRVQPEVSEFNLDPLEPIHLKEINDVQPARLDEITLREEIPRAEELQIDDDFGFMEIPPLQQQSSISEVPAPMIEKDIPIEQEKVLDTLPEEIQEKQLEILKEKEQEIPVPVVMDMEEIVPAEEQIVPAEEQIVPSVSIEKKSTKDRSKKPNGERVPIKSLQPILKLFDKTPRKFVPLNKEQETMKGIQFDIVLPKVSTFKPFKIFWSDWYISSPTIDVARGAKDVDSIRVSGKSLNVESESSGTPSVVTPLIQTVDIHAEMISESFLTPRKRPRKTFTEILPPAAESENSEIPSKRQKIVEDKEVPLERPVIEEIIDPVMGGESDTLEISSRPVQKTIQQSFHTNWRNDILEVISKRENDIDIMDICNDMGKKPIRLTMARIFATLLDFLHLMCIIQPKYSYSAEGRLAQSQAWAIDLHHINTIMRYIHC